MNTETNSWLPDVLFLDWKVDEIEWDIEPIEWIVEPIVFEPFELSFDKQIIRE
jgi:hypothetical protein